MGFWEPAKIDKDTQLELDKRVIIGLAKEKLTSQLNSVEKRLEKQREKLNYADHSNTSKRALNKLRNNYTFSIKERDSIQRRIDICEEYLKG